MTFNETIQFFDDFASNSEKVAVPQRGPVTHGKATAVNGLINETCNDIQMRQNGHPHQTHQHPE